MRSHHMLTTNNMSRSITTKKTWKSDLRSLCFFFGIYQAASLHCGFEHLNNKQKSPKTQNIWLCATCTTIFHASCQNLSYMMHIVYDRAMFCPKFSSCQRELHSNSNEWCESRPIQHAENLHKSLLFSLFLKLIFQSDLWNIQCKPLKISFTFCRVKVETRWKESDSLKCEKYSEKLRVKHA